MNERGKYLSKGDWPRLQRLYLGLFIANKLETTSPSEGACASKCTAANQFYKIFVYSQRTMRSMPAFSVSWINHEEGNVLLGQKYP